MRWRDGRRSDNIEDLRGERAPVGFGGSSALGRVLPLLIQTRIGRIVLIFGVLIYFGARLLGIDLLQLASAPPESAPPSQQATAQDRELVDFVSVVLADTEQTWHGLFAERHLTYTEPTLVLFRGAVQSACGFAQAAMGPFYCPGDHKLYLDLAFFDEMKRRLGAPGDFAQAYVIAHEVGHHVQTLLGAMDDMRRAQQGASAAQANRQSVRIELQADCYAGVWGHHADKDRQIIEAGDLEEALTAAAAVGDDTLQQANGRVRPETFTHGTAKQRVEWFRRGYDAGTIDSCRMAE